MIGWVHLRPGLFGLALSALVSGCTGSADDTTTSGPDTIPDPAATAPSVTTPEKSPPRPAGRALPTADAASFQLADAGVSLNGEWTPAAQDVDGVEMVLVPAGCFMMGSNEEEVDAAFDSCRSASVLGPTSADVEDVGGLIANR